MFTPQKSTSWRFIIFPENLTNARKYNAFEGYVRVTSPRKALMRLYLTKNFYDSWKKILITRFSSQWGLLVFHKLSFFINLLANLLHLFVFCTSIVAPFVLITQLLLHWHWALPLCSCVYVYVCMKMCSIWFLFSIFCFHFIIVY